MGDAIIETHKLKDAALSAAGGGDGENEHAPLRGWDFDLPLILNGASGARPLLCTPPLRLSFSASASLLTPAPSQIFSRPFLGQSTTGRISGTINVEWSEEVEVATDKFDGCLPGCTLQ